MNYIPVKFYNLISKEEYNNFSQTEKEDWLVKNKIYTKLDIDFSEDELKERIKAFGSKFKSCHSMNMEVHYEIIRLYLIDNFIHWDNMEMINEVNLKTSNAINDKDRKLILEKFHKKYLNALSKIEFSEQYFIAKNKNLDPFDFYFKDKVIYSITESFVMRYIFDSKTFYDDEDVFKQWSKVAKLDKTLDFIKGEINKLSNDSKSKNTTAIIKTDFNFKIFKDTKGETVFFELLNAFKAIDPNAKAIDIIFKPVCYSIRESEYSKLIFKKGLNLSDYLKYLKDDFNSNVNIKKSKYSTSNKYNSDVDNLLSKIE